MKPWYQQFWPWVLIVLPLSAVVGCMITVTLAFKYADQDVRLHAGTPNGLASLNQPVQIASDGNDG